MYIYLKLGTKVFLYLEFREKMILKVALIFGWLVTMVAPFPGLSTWWNSCRFLLANENWHKDIGTSTLVGRWNVRRKTEITGRKNQRSMPEWKLWEVFKAGKDLCTSPWSCHSLGMDCTRNQFHFYLGFLHWRCYLKFIYYLMHPH